MSKETFNARLAGLEQQVVHWLEMEELSVWTKHKLSKMRELISVRRAMIPYDNVSEEEAARLVVKSVKMVEEFTPATEIMNYHHQMAHQDDWAEDRACMPALAKGMS